MGLKDELYRTYFKIFCDFYKYSVIQIFCAFYKYFVIFTNILRFYKYFVIFTNIL